MVLLLGLFEVAIVRALPNLLFWFDIFQVSLKIGPFLLKIGLFSPKIGLVSLRIGLVVKKIRAVWLRIGLFFHRIIRFFCGNVRFWMGIGLGGYRIVSVCAATVSSATAGFAARFLRL